MIITTVNGSSLLLLIFNKTFSFLLYSIFSFNFFLHFSSFGNFSFRFGFDSFSLSNKYIYIHGFVIIIGSSCLILFFVAIVNRQIKMKINIPKKKILKPAQKMPQKKLFRKYNNFACFCQTNQFESD